MKRWWFAFSAALLWGATVLPAAAAVVPSYSYDAYAPLELAVEESQTDGNVKIDTVSFRSQSNLMRGIIVYPADPPQSMAAVLFAHWLGDPQTTNHTEFLEDAKWLARRGTMSLLLDEPWSQQDWFEKVRSNDTDARDSVATVIALRRGLDLLLGRTGVDPHRVAFVGHDFGAMYGALLAGADPRLSDVVLMTPAATFAEWFELDTARPPADKGAYEAQMGLFDIETSLAKGSYHSILLQFGDRDRYVPASDAKKLADAVSGNDKTVRTYHTGHALAIDLAVDDRRNWLMDKLELR